MFIRSIIALLAAMSVSAALAQTSAEEQQRRRAHLPSIRAATDCIAREALREPLAVDAVQQNRLHEILRDPMLRCTGPIGFMISEHDRLYGWGTGRAFFDGPYLQDVTRAVLARIKPDVDRRVTEAGRLEAERQAQVARAEAERRQRLQIAEQARNLLRDRMYECTTRQLVDLVSSSENANVLATAAMTICRREVDQALDAALEAFTVENGGSGSADLAQFRNRLRDVVRENVVTNAVQARAASSSTPTQPRSMAPATQPANANASGTGQTAVRDCLRSASKLREGKLVAQDELVKTMLELCRPEIETAARNVFAADPVITLDKARENTLTQAVTEARTLAGVTP
ncbi:hypothetical protein [Salinarimonas soli]|uniref:Uncharacterized protein n=1 Tax=Salinarimonas soli TaxID=1638099 RepID=A0A5B2V7S2_9HYPH|nr:hypothetical protein [Salinarimonas soli]KAA2235593.1 hypothetical protein F0L46_19015 [Salinarimonas soli]